MQRPLRLLLRLLLGLRLPITAGSLAAAGLKRPVLIGRDSWGIPHIEAESEADAWYGLGFCHGQDRAFQLEALLRVTRGTLAELTGAEGLPFDRLARRIGFMRGVEEQLEAVEPEIRVAIEAYVGGVNAGATIGMHRRAHEFALLRRAPTPWTAPDVMGVLRLQCLLFGFNADTELARLKILREDGAEAVVALNPSYPSWHPVSSPPGTLAGPAADRLAGDLAAFSAAVGGVGGSNAWALAGTRTSSGRPLLACDPHLPPLLPSPWYLAHLRTPEWSLAGASFVGGPAMPAGHNGYAAWGVTASLVDSTDLFVEEVGPDGASVRHGDGFVPCEVLRERIIVRGAKPVTEVVLVSPRGPIVGPALEGEVGAVSLRAFWLGIRPVRGLLGIHRARSFEEFRETFALWSAPCLNMIYADVSESLGWQLVGEVPRRRKGSGMIPLPGWDLEAGWEEEPVPFDDLPRLRDPEVGFVANANNRPLPEGVGPFLGEDWIDGYRLARIVEMIQGRSDWDVAGVQRMQMDQYSLPWEELRGRVLAAPGNDPETRRALDLLSAWDGRVSAGSPAAAVFEFFLHEMGRRLAQTKAPRSCQWVVGGGFGRLIPVTSFAFRRVGHLVRLLSDQPEGWISRPWTEEVADALGAAVRRLSSLHGPSPARWAWGRIRPLTLEHYAGQRKPLDRLFNLGPIPWGGDANTVSQASVDPVSASDNPGFISSMRMVVDVGAWSQSRFVIPAGQSANPLSPHYADQLPLWQRGQGVPIPWTKEEVDQATRHRLWLFPAVR